MSLARPYLLRVQYAGLTLEFEINYYPGTPAVLNPPDVAHPGDPSEIEYRSIRALDARGQPYGPDLRHLLDHLSEGEYYNIFDPLLEEALTAQQEEDIVRNYERRSEYGD